MISAVLACGAAWTAEPTADDGLERIPAYRKRAAQAEDPAPVWIEAASDDSDAVRMEAVRQLSAFSDDARVIPALEKLARTKPRLLTRGGPLYPFDTVATTALQRIRAEQEWTEIVRTHAGIRDRVRAAAEAFRTGDPHLRKHIQEFLVDVSDECVVDLLLADDSYEEATCRAIAQRIKQGRRLYEETMRRLRATAGPFRGAEEDAEQRRRELWCAAMTLGRLGDEQCLPELLRALVLDDRVDSDGSLEMLVGQTIASFGERALRPLGQYLQAERSGRGRYNAAATLGRIGGPKAIEILRAAISREDEFPEDPSCVSVKEAMQAQLERLLRKQE